MKQSLTKPEELTVNTYNQYAAEWVKGHGGGNFWEEEINIFKKYLPTGKVIEIGSGGGRDARELIKLGYDYIGTDISLGLLKQARKLNPGEAFFKQSVYKLDFPKNKFDGFWASAVLLHIPKKRINEALMRIRSVVRKDGIGFISIKQGVGERIVEDEPEPGKKFRRLFTFYSQEEFADALRRNGFEVLETSVKPVTEKTTWLVYFVKLKK